jgi:hypothetical protein
MDKKSKQKTVGITVTISEKSVEKLNYLRKSGFSMSKIVDRLIEKYVSDKNSIDSTISLFDGKVTITKNRKL